MIGDKKEGHFKHSSKQLCVYIHHMYIYNAHDTFSYISYCVILRMACKPGANEKHSESLLQVLLNLPQAPSEAAQAQPCSKYEVFEQFEVPVFVGHCFMKAKILTALTSVDLNADDAKECKVRLRRWVSSPKAGEDSAGDAWTS